MAGHVLLSLQRASEMGGDTGTQFEPHSDDEDTLYNVEKILVEAGRRYLVQWEGRDPTTGKKWPPDWVLYATVIKHSSNDDFRPSRVLLNGIKGLTELNLDLDGTRDSA
ncbi:hypothetical protein BDV93DRAFT_561477 [Ceratobasidium sp. AG-I]|nr:hypothetical protein BDV93DRAFT_561477 [Ceratobasidium sp. AG-I]